MYSINNSFGLRTAFASVFPDLCKGDYLNQIKSTEEIKMEEIWKPIKNYEGLYEISNLGRVKSLAKEWKSHNGGIIRQKEMIRKPRLSGDNYLYINLSKKNLSKIFAIHCLVYDHFGKGNINRHKLNVDHINNNKTDNRIDNLQLLSTRANVSKGFRLKKTSSRFTGVCFVKNTSKWKSAIYFNGKVHHLGFFDNELEAANTYQKALNGIFPPKRKHTSKYKGVCWVNHINKWKAYVCINGKSKHIGYFTNEQDAAEAHKIALKDVKT